jgi:hypothetical protein
MNRRENIGSRTTVEPILFALLLDEAVTPVAGEMKFPKQYV